MNAKYLKQGYLLGSPINEWIYLDEYKLSLYYRINKRVINNEIISSIDLANIQIDREYQNKGYFSKFISELEQEISQFHIVIFIENIINPVLSNYLRNIGYSLMDNNMNIDQYCSMYKQL